MPKAKGSKTVVGEAGPGGVSIVDMPPSFDFLRSIQVWQGKPKMGKTSTAAALGPAAKKLGLDGIDPFFMLFEPGSGGVNIKGTSEKCCSKRGCPDCEGVGTKRKILSTLDEIDEWFKWVAASKYNPIVIDTGDAMYQAVADSVCVRLGIPNPTASDHGIAWVNIFDEFRGSVGTLTGAGKSLIFIMHVYMQEKRVTGGTINTATFNISGKSRQFIASQANQIFHFDVVPNGKSDKFVIRTKPSAGIEAGDHWGICPEEIDRGDSPEEAATALLKCFYEV